MLIALDTKQYFHSLRVVCCCLISFFLSVEMGLNNPYWSVLTCVAVCEYSNQAFRLKGQYRILGTLLSGLLGLAVSSIFINSPYLLIVISSIIASSLLASATIDIPERKYFYQITSITLLLFSIEAVSSPGNVFNVVVSRCLEIIVGVFVVSLVDMVTSKRLDNKSKIFIQSSTTKCLVNAITKNDFCYIKGIKDNLKGAFTDYLLLKNNRDLSKRDIKTIFHLNVKIAEIYTLIMIEFSKGNPINNNGFLSRKIDQVLKVESDYILNEKEGVATKEPQKIIKIKTHYKKRCNLVTYFTSFLKSSLLLFILFIFWHATQYSAAPDMVVFGFLAYALIDNVDGYSEKLKSLLFFVMISLCLGWSFTYCLLPIASDWLSFCIIILIFIAPLIVLSKRYPLLKLSIIVAIGAIKLQDNYIMLNNSFFINEYIGELTGIAIAFFTMNIFNFSLTSQKKIMLLSEMIQKFFSQADVNLINNDNLTYNLWDIVANFTVSDDFTKEDHDIFHIIERAYQAVSSINGEFVNSDNHIPHDNLLEYILKR